MQFVHKTRKIAGVEEQCLTVYTQISMLNHANHLEVAKPPTTPATTKPGSAKTTEYKAFTGYSELQKVAIKARGVELLNMFLDDPMAKKIPLSAGLKRVALGVADDVSEDVSESMSEVDQLEPIQLPGAVDTFDHEGESFE